MIFNISLFFDNQTQKEIISYSEKLGRKLEIRPHLTLVKFEMVELSKDIIEKMNQFSKKKIKLKFSGLNITNEHNNIWIEISVLKSKELIDLQKEISETMKIKPRNGIGDDYRPHITLANMEENKEITITELDTNLLKKEVVGELDYYSYDFKK